MKNQIVLPFALFLVLLIGSCVKDEFCDDDTNPDCPNFDPCTQVIAANSDFKIVGIVSSATDTLIEIEIDTAYGGGRTHYKALVIEGIESYSWKVGLDPTTFTGPEVNLDFTGYSGDVSVTLETTAANTGMCLEEFQLRDIKTKRIHYADRSRVGSIYGVFKGTLLGDTDGREYEVRVGNSLPHNRLYGLPMPADCTLDDRGIPIYYAYQFFVSNFRQVRSTFQCRGLIVVGRINLEDSNELRIEYVYDDAGSEKEVVFVGRRQ